jgi:hypothetical protein
MPVSHARAAVVTSTDGKEAGEVPGLLEVLAQVLKFPRKRLVQPFTSHSGTRASAADRARIGVGTRCRLDGRTDVPHESGTPAAAVDLPRPVGSLDDVEHNRARLDGRAAAMAADLQPAPGRDAGHAAVLGEPDGSSDRGRLASPV